MREKSRLGREAIERNAWGLERRSVKAATDWITIDAPHLRILADGQWIAAHGRLEQILLHHEPAPEWLLGWEAPAKPEGLLDGLVQLGTSPTGLAPFMRGSVDRRAA